MAGRRARALPWAALLLAAAGCKAEPEPLFAATCAPTASLNQVTCTVRNHGQKASRACLRARVQSEAGAALVARRVCTKVIEPGGAAEVTPPFARLGRTDPAELLSRHCTVNGQWACKVDVFETPREMAENLPKER